MGAAQRAALEDLREWGLRRATARAPSPGAWRLDALAGRLVELSSAGASAALTLAFGLVLEAQRAGEPAAWIAGAGSTFHPPDVAAGGVDLEALPVVRAVDLRQAVRAADTLARSGAFGLLILDLGDRGELPQAVLTRLTGQASRHAMAVVVLTAKAEGHPSLGSLVSLRGAAERARLGEDRFACQMRVLKDKRSGPGWVAEEVCRGPAGLR